MSYSTFHYRKSNSNHFSSTQNYWKSHVKIEYISLYFHKNVNHTTTDIHSSHSCYLIDPITIVRNFRKYSRILSARLNAPRHNSDLFTMQHKRTARVTLKFIWRGRSNYKNDRKFIIAATTTHLPYTVPCHLLVRHCTEWMHVTRYPIAGSTLSR